MPAPIYQRKPEFFSYLHPLFFSFLLFCRVAAIPDNGRNIKGNQWQLAAFWSLWLFPKPNRWNVEYTNPACCMSFTHTRFMLEATALAADCKVLGQIPKWSSQLWGAGSRCAWAATARASRCGKNLLRRRWAVHAPACSHTFSHCCWRHCRKSMFPMTASNSAFVQLLGPQF